MQLNADLLSHSVQALAESVLESERGSLPIAIVRPSIVVAAWREPVPGKLFIKIW